MTKGKLGGDTKFNFIKSHLTTGITTRVFLKLLKLRVFLKLLKLLGNVFKIGVRILQGFLS